MTFKRMTYHKEVLYHFHAIFNKSKFLLRIKTKRYFNVNRALQLIHTSECSSERHQDYYINVHLTTSSRRVDYSRCNVLI